MTARQARKYAQGLLGAVSEATDLDQLANEVVEAASALKGAPPLMEVLINPAISAQRKLRIVDASLASAGVSELARRFLGIVVGHGHAFQLSVVAAAVRVEVDARLGVIPADIRTAATLDEAQKGRLVEALERSVGGRVRARFTVDATLLAGVVARVGDLVFDGSARRQLGLIRERLTRAHV